MSSIFCDRSEGPSGQCQYLVLSSVDGCEEEQVGQEEADAELQVEGGAGALDGSAQQEGEGRQEEAQQREAQPHVGDHSQGRILLLGPGKEEMSVTLSCSGIWFSPFGIGHHKHRHKA